MLNVREKQNLKQYVAEDNARLAQIFETLGDANRCKLFRVFIKRTNLNVGEVASILGASVPLTSQHLKILERNDLLVREKIGREVFYRVNDQDPQIHAIINAILE